MPAFFRGQDNEGPDEEESLEMDYPDFLGADELDNHIVDGDAFSPRDDIDGAYFNYENMDLNGGNQLGVDYADAVPVGYTGESSVAQSVDDYYTDYTQQSISEGIGRKQIPHDYANYESSSGMNADGSAIPQAWNEDQTNYSEYSNQDDGRAYESEYDQPAGLIEREPYPAWTEENEVPITKEEIKLIFEEFEKKFGFQHDSVSNIYDFLMVLLDSRASRMSPSMALTRLHADYISGPCANYRKWYFAAHMDVEDSVGLKNCKISKKKVREKKDKTKKKKTQEESILDEGIHSFPLDDAEANWNARMLQMRPETQVRQLALYLLCWGEANNVRFVPECLCFIFKLANDYMESEEYKTPGNERKEGDYLDNAITPLYLFMHDQQFEIIGGKYVRRERDHAQLIGYDDINHFFWYAQGIARITLSDGTRLIDLPREQRFHRLHEVVWKDVFCKSFYESRSWFHLITDFNRIWVIHFTTYWYYTVFNSPTFVEAEHHQALGPRPAPAAQWSSVALGGVVATILMLLATLFEWLHVPRSFPGAKPLTKRFICLTIILLLNLAPAVFIFGFSTEEQKRTPLRLTISILHFLFSLFIFVWFSTVPLGSLFTPKVKKNSRRFLANRYFTANYAPLQTNDMFVSWGLWLLVFGAKFAESYFFLSLSFRDPILVLSTMKPYYCNDYITGSSLCMYQPKFILAIMYVTDLVLFFLDTYLWYILVNTIFSVSRSFFLGISIWTPWRNIFARMPKRIYSKILATSEMEVKYKPKMLVSQVWNAIVISLYREHLLSIEHVQRLLYHQVASEVGDGTRSLKAPTFFVSQEDQSFKTEYFPVHSEAERRLSFFAQSLATPIPEPVPVDEMPTFTVLVPHYGEKILLSLKEIIREQDKLSRVTLLEYLKQLHANEWDNFVKDTKILAEENAAYEDGPLNATSDPLKDKIDDLPYYCIGFKNATPEYTLRTRIWASLRSQTLYRTISGFMNYSRAIKLLYRVENPEVVQMFQGDMEHLDAELQRMSRRKFKMCVSMQRYAKFNKEEYENTEFILRAYPDLLIAYLDEDPPLEEGGEPRLYAALIDGYSEIMENGRRKPKYRIRLSGNPILGDGKSDNQNMALPFFRGEYIQLVDANQDNYLEECLKIRSILAEFEEMETDEISPFLALPSKSDYNPVAILGAREYIFSENIGILGDVAAGKEQTFGTLFARTLAQIGGKLHYGHPDFLNAVFMTTRGGVSKAQKGLHVNEDIYAGMTALQRGGRIKHCEYYQCGKGRDLGFGSILNFTTKIGTGMGEQMLSREYYYLGTQLPVDRFLSFYYAHPGFHINNMFIMFSVQLFMLVIINLGAMYHVVTVCDYDHNQKLTVPLMPPGCYNLKPVLDWVKRCILSIFIVFFISFVPLTVQELTERGAWRAVSRLAKHFASFSPIFEVFTCQIYGQSVIANLSFGGARYIGTGRGFATARLPFYLLFSRFAGPSIYLGFRTLTMLLFGSMTMWVPHLVYFWISTIAMCVSPFVFNPHQFSWTDFFVDYREFIRWLSRGNSKSHANSWIGYCRLSRTRITGYKRKLIGQPSDKISMDTPKAHFTNMFLFEIFIPFLLIIITVMPYIFINSQPGNPNADEATNSLARILILAFAPIVIGGAVSAGFAATACCLGPVLGICCKKFGSVLAAIAHAISIMIFIVTFEVLWFMESWCLAKTTLGIIAITAIQRFFFKILQSVFLTRELKHDGANLGWWTGKWYSQGLGFHALSQPLREFVCKIVELNMFASDFFLGHVLMFMMFPILCIPFIDRWHSMMLFWLRPSRQIRPPIYSLRQSRLRKRIVQRYFVLFMIILFVFLSLLIVPAVMAKRLTENLDLDFLSGFRLFQPPDVNWTINGSQMSTVDR